MTDQGKKKSCLPLCGADANKGERPITLVRALVCLSLLVAAVVCGTVSYLVLRASEHKNYCNQYDAAAQQMKRSVEDMLAKYHATADQLAVIANVHFSNSSSWPYVGIHDFYLVDESIINVTKSASGNSILPIVPTEQLTEFNDYARDFLAGEEWITEYPQVYDIYDLGVWNTKDGVPVTITDGIPHTFEGRDLIVPVLNPPLAGAKGGFTLGNLHGVKEIGIALDDILTCTEQGHVDCASLSNYLLDTRFEGVSETSIYRPIFSVDTPPGETRRVLGFTTVGFSWRQELQRLIIGDDISGLDVVLSSLQQPTHTVAKTYTFSFKGGAAEYAGQGDMHDRSYSSMGVDVPLSLVGSKTVTSFQYLLTIYPTAEYENRFYTDAPLFTAIGFAAMIIFTSIIFFLYDYLVNKNAKWKDHILKVKRDFVRFISHEIRTPLNTVSVGLQLIYEGLAAQQAGDEEVVRDLLELTLDVQTGTSTAVSVLNDLLNFDKLQSGELQIAQGPVPVWETVATVVRSFKIPAMQKNIAVELLFENHVSDEVSCDELVVTGDKFKICHVIRNLMSNALKFTADGGSIVVKMLWENAPLCEKSPPLSRQSSHAVVPEVSSDISLATISVTDSGYGLTAEQIGLLFKDGVQFNPNELQAGQGSGLGLFLSQAIASMHGGKMWATSEGQNKGATFNVQFPVEIIPASPVKHLLLASNEPACVSTGLFTSGDNIKRISREQCESSPMVLYSSRESVTGYRSPAKEDNSNSKLKEHVLVVDDVASNRKIVCRMLRKRGYICEEAKDGKEAIEVIEEKKDSSFFACVLMDFEMPIMNGPQATAALRALGYRIPIYGLTGNVMVDDIEFFLHHGADQVLTKPFQISEFETHMMESKV